WPPTRCSCCTSADSQRTRTVRSTARDPPRTLSPASRAHVCRGTPPSPREPPAVVRRTSLLPARSCRHPPPDGPAVRTTYVCPTPCSRGCHVWHVAATRQRPNPDPRRRPPD